MPEHSQLLRLYRNMVRLPFGHSLFSKAICFKAPYFGSISPKITVLENARCEAVIKDRRAIHNHIGTVHAIAMCNLAELSAGVMIDASLPADMRWIPKGMTVSYLKKATGTLRSIATPTTPIISSVAGYDLPVNVDVVNSQGEKVFEAEIRMWMSPKPSKTG